MAREYAIEVTGAVRTERGILNVERALARELRQASRDTRDRLVRYAKEVAPQPRADRGGAPWEEKGAGIGGRFVPPGGLRRFAGRFPGGAPIVSLTYEVTLFVEEDHLAAYFETGTGERGPEGSKYPIYPTRGRALLLTGGHSGNVSGHWLGNRGAGQFDGGNSGENLPIFDHVMHPGIAPRPFLEKTAQDHSTEIDVLYDRAVANALRGF